MWLGFSGDRTIQDLNLYATNILKKQLETIDGVGEIRIGGRRDRTIRVNLIVEKMSSLNIAANDVVNAFNKEHIQLPGGYLVKDQSEKMFKLDLEYHQIDKLNDLVVAYRNDGPIKISDIAEIEDGLEDYRETARFNGLPSVGLGIVKVANSNTVDIINKVKLKLDEDISLIYLQE